MSDQPYRTPGRDVDKTEVEITKIREAAETKRKLIEEREKTKRQDLSERDTAGYVVPKIVAGITILLIALIGYYAWEAYVQSRTPESTCREESRKKSDYSTMKCPHSLHVLVNGETEWTCKCGVPKLP